MNDRTAEPRRHVSALYRHFLEFLENPCGTDEESGIPHYERMARDMAFVAELMAKEGAAGRRAASESETDDDVYSDQRRQEHR